jgi:hypothetical protein
LKPRLMAAPSGQTARSKARPAAASRRMIDGGMESLNVADFT